MVVLIDEDVLEAPEAELVYVLEFALLVEVFAGNPVYEWVVRGSRHRGAAGGTRPSFQLILGHWRRTGTV